MKKTVNVSLGGYAFTIEEDAYERLARYLEGVKRRFASYPDATEIVDDIEARMGEKLTSQSAAPRVLALPVIESLIAEMGDADEIDQDKTDDRHAAPSAPKRLFRDGDNAIIAGVCAGLSAYFGIDPVWLRLAFVVSVFFGGVGIVAYLVLWLVVPRAESGLEKAQMHGRPFNLDEFERDIKERFERIRAEDGPRLRQAGAGLSTFFRDVFGLLGRALSGLGKIFFKIIGAIISIAATIALASVVFVLITLVVNSGSPALDWGVVLPLTPLMLGLLALSVAITVGVPLVFLALLGNSLGSGRNRFTRMLGFNLLALWIVGLAAVTSFAIRYGPQVREGIERDAQSQVTQEFNLSGFSSIRVEGARHVTVTRAPAFAVSANATQRAMERLSLRIEQGTLVISEADGHWGACLFCWYRPAHVTVAMPQLQTIEATGASTADVRGFDGSTIAIHLSGASRATLAGEWASLQADLSGASQLAIEGTIRALSAQLSGASRMQAGQSVEQADLELSGASRAALATVGRLSVRASGASRVHYHHVDTIIRSDLSGGSRLQHDPDGAFPSVPDAWPIPPDPSSAPRRLNGSGTTLR